MRVAAELERCEPSQMAWILTPNGALCAQQYQKFAERLPIYQHRLLLGSDGVDKWKDKAIWDHILKDIRVVISTPQILLDALDSGFVRLSNIALLVLDEAHRARKESPMRVIMRNWYDCAPAEEKPATLSLTASPGDPSSLQSIMHAEVMTPKLCRAELARFVHLPELIIIPFDTDPNHSWPGLARLKQLYDEYDFRSDPYVLQLMQYGVDPEDPRIIKAFEERKTTCAIQLKRVLNKTTEIMNQLGAYAADWYLRKIASKMSATQVSVIIKDLATDERKHLLAVLEKSLQGCKPIPDCCGDMVTTKFNLLVNQLTSNAAHGSTGIIFVEQRATVAALTHLLSVHPDSRSAFRYGPFVGSSQTGDKVDIGDLFDMRAQEIALKDFRAGSGGILVATNVLEEGIDIPSCNFVICYDEPKNVVSFVQRRGRARQEKSKYVLFMDRCSNKAEKFQRLEEEMVKSYEEDQSRIRLELEKEIVVEKAYREWVVESTGAKLTLENAKRRLFHFLQTVAADHTNMHPEYEFELDETGFRTAKVTLPKVVNPKLGSHTGTAYWSTERAAVRDASFEAVLALHKEGLINDHLLPLLSADIREQMDIDRDLHSTIWTPSRINPWHDIAAAWGNRSDAIASNITVESRYPPLTMSLLLPKSLPIPSDVVLYGMANDMTKLRWEHKPSIPTTENKVDSAKRFTKMAMSAVLLTRLKDERDDYILPFAPAALLALEDDNRNEKLGLLSHRAPIHDHSLNWSESLDLGFVRDDRFPGRIYVPEKIHEAIPTPMWTPQLLTKISTEVGKQLCVRASRFPKRMYGLHSNKDREDWKPESIDLPLQYSTMDSLPIRYAQFVLVYPALLHYWEPLLLAAQLRQTLLAPLHLSKDDYLTEAISAPSARLVYNYERLEFLGDRLLKFAVALHLMNKYPLWPEKYLALQRDILVSNVYLAKNAMQAGLDRFISTATFAGNKWRPSYVHEAIQPQVGEGRMLSTKVIADVVEAVIAAAYLEGLEDNHTFGAQSSSETDKAALNKACSCINILLPHADLQQPTAALNELYTTAESASLETIQLLPELEQLIGYKFRNPTLLLTAITHASSNLGQCSSYDRLEYLGDAILDHLVTRPLFFHHSKMPPSRLHTAKECLVNADFLAFTCLSWSINADRTELELAPDSALYHDEPTWNLKSKPIQHRFWEYMRHSSLSISDKQHAAAARFESLKDNINEALETGKVYPWRTLTELRAPKFFSDIIESLIGAVYIDSHGSLRACEELIERMGINRYLRRMLAEQETLVLLHPKERVGILARGRKVEYVLEDSVREGSVREGSVLGGSENQHNEDIEDIVSCTVYIAGSRVASISTKGLRRAQLEVLAATEAVLVMETVDFILPASTDDHEAHGINDGDEMSEEEQAAAGVDEPEC